MPEPDEGETTTDARSFNERVQAFWRWFEAEEADIRAGIADNTFEPDATHAAMEEVSPHLSWEYCPVPDAGCEGFAVSSAGDPALRFLAERLVQAAPALPHWRFFTSKQSGEGAVQLGVGDHVIDFEELRFACELDLDKECIHVSVHHGSFAEIPEEVCHQAIFIALDTALGEDVVELWLGAIEPAREATADHHHTVESLKGAVHALLTEHGLDPQQHPLERWFGYERNDDAPAGPGPRGDIVVGSTRIPQLHESAEQAVEVIEEVSASGAVLAFVRMTPRDDSSGEARIDSREAVFEPLADALEKRGAGVSFGRATGEGHDYADLILFDEPSAIEIIRAELPALGVHADAVLGYLAPDRANDLIDL